MPKPVTAAIAPARTAETRRRISKLSAFTLGVRRGQKLDLMLVKRVDQGNEPRRLVAHIAAHHRNADDDDRVVAPGDREIIGCAARFSA